jgi:thymidylate synthase (FAD)
MDSAWSTYRILVEKGVPAEDARYVLPNACQTKILVSMNARELLHFFNKRCCNRAQWEIRAVATEMLRLVKREFPVLFHNAGPSCMDHPCPEKDKTCGKPWKRWPDYDKVLPFSEGSDV